MSIHFATIPSKRLVQGITSASTTFYINNILSFDGENDVTPSDLGTQHFCCFRNDTGTRVELMEIDPATISTGPITILRRGLSFYGDLTTEDADLKLDWPANETIVQLGTDVPQIFQWLKEYIDNASIAGAVPASTSAAGIVVEGSQAEVDAGTATKSISAVAYKLFAPLDKRRGKLINDYAVDSVGTDSYAITISPAITAYTAGQRFTFKAGTVNTGPCTLNVSGLGAKTIKKNVSVDLQTGDILANQIVEVEYDGTNMQLLSRTNYTAPITRVYPGTVKGSSTTQFDITNPSGTTFRYTYDGNGTDPGITSVTFPAGNRVLIASSAMSAGNTGSFVVTASGANFFEVTNASGVAETNKALSKGYLYTFNPTWTKPSGLKYISVRLVGGGGKGGVGSDGTNTGGAGGSGGGYSEKIIDESALGATETLTVGIQTETSSFGSHLQATGGASASATTVGLSGEGSLGDFNSRGSSGIGNVGVDGGGGGASVLGGGGTFVNGENPQPFNAGFGGGGAGGDENGDGVGGYGGTGALIVIEYY